MMRLERLVIVNCTGRTSGSLDFVGEEVVMCHLGYDI